MRQPAQFLEAAEEVSRLARQAQALLPETGDDPGIKTQAQDIDENPDSGLAVKPLEAHQPQAHRQRGLPQGGHHLVPEARPQVKTAHVIAAGAEGDHPDAGQRPLRFPPQAVHHFQQGAVAAHRHHPVKPLPAGPGGQGFSVAGPFGPPGSHVGARLSQRRQEAGPEPARPGGSRRWG